MKKRQTKKELKKALVAVGKHDLQTAWLVIVEELKKDGAVCFFVDEHGFDWDYSKGFILYAVKPNRIIVSEKGGC